MAMIMLPIVRPYEYLIIQKLIESAGSVMYGGLIDYLKLQIEDFSKDAMDHAIKYMLNKPWFVENINELILDATLLDVEFEEYMRDLLNYGIGKYEIDYGERSEGEVFRLWSSYRKTQTAQLMLIDPGDINKGTKIIDGVVYAYVTVLKDERLENLDYDDGYIDSDTFQWESVANIKETELDKLKNCNEMHIFVRKVKMEDNITLPFTYIGKGAPYYLNGPKKNGAHLFKVEMENAAPEDIYFDFKLRRLR